MRLLYLLFCLSLVVQQVLPMKKTPITSALPYCTEQKLDYLRCSIRGATPRDKIETIELGLFDIMFHFSQEVVYVGDSTHEQDSVLVVVTTAKMHIEFRHWFLENVSAISIRTMGDLSLPVVELALRDKFKPKLVFIN